MPGYANRLVYRDYPNLGDDIRVIMRNPKLMTTDELSGDNVEINPVTGLPVDMQAAKWSMYGTVAKLIVGWTVFDATAPMVDEDLTEIDQPALPMPATAENVAKLPSAILGDLVNVVKEALNPQ
jgi:hypothetical protein